MSLSKVWQQLLGSVSQRPRHDYEMMACETSLQTEILRSKFVDALPGKTAHDSVISARSDGVPLLNFSKAAAVNVEEIDPSIGEKLAVPGIFYGWRVGVTICAITAAVVFIVNLVVFIWATAKFGTQGGIGTVQEGSCARTQSLSLWLHVIINALSTLLFSASNYTMQCLCSPTREEVDRAHKRNIYLDIGVPSLRNLGLISRNRVVLWSLLALTGIPLHLLYNSAVFPTLFAQDHSVYAISAPLIDQNPSTWPTLQVGRSENATTHFSVQLFQDVAHWDRLENEECINAYSKKVISDRGDLLVVTKNGSDVFQEISNTYNASGYCFNCDAPYAWICYDYQNDRDNHPVQNVRDHHPQYLNFSTIWCDPSAMIERKQAVNWTVSSQVNGTENYLVQYCLSKPIKERCKVQFSVVILVIVIGCNLLKSLCMFGTLWYQRAQPLVTIGDAIESFLSRADPTTENMCLASKKHFYSRAWKEKAIKLNSKALRWSKAPSMRRWATCNAVLFTTIVLTLTISLAGGMFSLSLSQMWQLGYGHISSDNILPLSLPGSIGLIFTIILTNLPQSLLSFLVFTYNGLFTCMLLAHEVSEYANTRKPLRVSYRTGQQRSTYRLQLPYRYGIPLLVVAGLLHLLLSQMIFLARVDTFGSDGTIDTANSFSSIGSSPIAILTFLLVSSVFLALAAGTGAFRRYTPGFPLTASCSAAISATCHRPIEDVHAADLPVKWGAVLTQRVDGHCCFSSQEVLLPNPVKSYR